MNPSSEWVLLARILRPQGRKGEVLADLFTETPEHFATHPAVWLAPAGFREGAGKPAGAAAPLLPAEVAAHWLPVGRNAGRVVLHFAGVSTIGEAETLAGREVVIPAAERAPLEQGAVYIAELLGATVFDGAQAIGVVEEVEFPTTPDGSRRLEEAAPLLRLRSDDGEEILVPFVAAYLVEMDLEHRSIRMTLPRGLAGLNRRADRPEKP
ncbi:MAG: 16S rRNA processing protein RimM [Acidobacteriota bacterium]|nr:16S rRNA processing protein RimM [Acidobacteriota bacterium]